MNRYPWLNAPYQQLVALHQQGRGHHALLLQSLPGMGDSALVRALGRWLMCQQHDDLKSCGRCHSCQLMMAGTHPDWYQLEAGAGKIALGIDSVRQINEKIWHHAQQGGAKVVWLPDAAQLTEAAANALLKTLEEPPADSWFILCSHQPGRLPATLRSRCLNWHLAPPAEEQGLAWLVQQSGKSQDEALAALRLSGGAPAAAQDLLTDNKMWQARQALSATLETALAGELLALFPVLNHDDVSQRLVWLCALLLDAQKWQQGAAAMLSNPDQQRLTGQLAASLSASTLARSLRQWLRCREQLLNVAAVNRELLLIDQLLRWESLLATSPEQRGR